MNLPRGNPIQHQAKLLKRNWFADREQHRFENGFYIVWAKLGILNVKGAFFSHGSLFVSLVSVMNFRVFLFRVKSHNIDVFKVSGLYRRDSLKANQFQNRQKRHNLFNLACEF